MLRIIFYLFLLLNIALPSFCAPPNQVKTVYRISEEDPQTVFNHGFVSWGTNDSLLEHISGRSVTVGAVLALPQGRTSAFIATTASNDYFRRLFFDRLVGEDGERRYLYTIRADNTFYDVAYSLQQALNAPGITGRQQRDIQEMYDQYFLQREYIAYRTIPRENIISVIVYQYSAATHRWSVPEGDAGHDVNINYHPGNTSSNTSPWTNIIMTTSTSNAIFAVPGESSSLISSDLVDGACFSGNPRRLGDDGALQRRGEGVENQEMEPIVDQCGIKNISKIAMYSNLMQIFSTPPTVNQNLVTPSPTTHDEL